MRRHGSPEELETIRLRAFDLAQQGMPKADIALALDRSPNSIGKWIKCGLLHGRDALKSKPHRGATPKLDQKQMLDLRDRLMAGAAANEFDTNLWTCARVRELIQRIYGVTYHVDHLSRLLRSLGFSCQKPQRKPAERDDEAVNQWKVREWTRIKKNRVESVQPLRLSTKAGCC